MSKPFLKLAAIPVAAAVLALPQVLPAQEPRNPAPQQASSREVVTRVYSLRTLLEHGAALGNRASAAPAAQPGMPGGYPGMDPMMGGYPGGMGGGGFGGGGGSAVAEPDQFDDARRQETVQQVVSLITDTIASDTWRENGGAVGAIRELNGQLVVTHTPGVHQQVSDLLDDLQQRDVVTVRAVLVRLPEAQVEENSELVDGVALWRGDITEAPAVARVRYSGFDGRRHTVTEGRQVSYVSNIQPVVAANAVGYQFTIGRAQDGLTLNVLPTLAGNGEDVTLDIQADYVLLDGIRPTTQPAAGSEIAQPDRLIIDRRSIDTTLRLPTGQWALVGTVNVSRDGQAATDEPLHLLVRVDAAGGDSE